MSPLVACCALLPLRPIEVLPLCSDCAGDDVLPQDCRTEEEAAKVLGYTQLSWDNISGEEKQPLSMDKYWDELTELEQVAAFELGYTPKMWDKGKKLPPAMEKHWAELTTSCGDVHHL